MIFFFYFFVGTLLFLAGADISGSGDRTLGKLCLIGAFLCILFRLIFTSSYPAEGSRLEIRTFQTNQVVTEGFTFNSSKVFRVKRYRVRNYGLALDHEYMEFYDPEDGEVGSYVIQIHTPQMKVRPWK